MKGMAEGHERWRVEKILFLKGNYAIFKGRDAQEKQAVLVGTLSPPPVVGNWLWLKTAEVEHPKYGKRRQIIHYAGLAPAPQASDRPLNAWTRLGFDERAARWLYQRYGKHTQRVLDHPTEVLVPGVPSSVLERLFGDHALLLEALIRELAFGNTAPPRGLIGQRLGLEEEDLFQRIESALREGLIVEEKGRIGFARYHRVEREIHRQVQFRQNRHGRRYQLPPGHNLSSEQLGLFHALERSRLVTLTGGPGTGKTTTSAALLKSPSLELLTAYVAAPTGKAARRIAEVSGREAETLHRLIGIGEDSRRRRPRHNARNPLNADLVVVDESSMIDVELMELFLQGVSPRTQILLIGDADQLPPVGPGRPFADLLGKIETVRLTQVFRQAAENPIVSAAYDVKNGRVPLPDGDRLQLVPYQDADEALEHVVEHFKHAAPHPQVLTAGNTGPLGTKALNLRLQDIANPKGTPLANIAWGMTIREGDPAVWIENDYDLGLMNGELGVVYQEVGELIFDTGEQRVAIPRAKRGKLLLAYAMTVHRAQGSEWPVVLTILDIGHQRLLSRELLYTALTRSKERHVLVYHPDALTVARSNRSSGRFTWLALL